MAEEHKEVPLYAQTYTFDNIYDLGFRNIRHGEAIAGFQVQIMDSYYRGIYVPLIDGIEVTVDGERFGTDKVKCKFRDNIYSQDDLQNHPEERWQWMETCTLIVSKPGGLKPGWHDIKIVVKERLPYMPIRPQVREYEARLAMVSEPI
jgi:hypothetical protein